MFFKDTLELYSLIYIKIVTLCKNYDQERKSLLQLGSRQLGGGGRGETLANSQPLVFIFRCQGILPTYDDLTPAEHYMLRNNAEL